eukprot:6319634-Amphidinium_carterae.1
MIHSTCWGNAFGYTSWDAKRGGDHSKDQSRSRQGMLNNNLHQRDSEYQQAIQGRDEEYIQAMRAISAQKDVDMFNLSHLRNILEEIEGVFRAHQQEVQTYMGCPAPFLQRPLNFSKGYNK